MTNVEQIKRLYTAIAETVDNPLFGGCSFPPIRADPHLSIAELTDLLNWMDTLGTVTLNDDRSSYEGAYDDTYHLWVRVEPKGSYTVVAYIGFVYQGKRNDLVTYVEGRYPKTA